MPKREIKDTSRIFQDGWNFKLIKNKYRNYTSDEHVVQLTVIVNI